MLSRKNSIPFFFQLDSDQESTDGEDEATQSGEPLDDLDANILLFRAARVHNVPLMSQALALGADRDWTNENFSTAIHQSILSGSVMACEFLLLNGAKINAVDAEGNTPLHLSAMHRYDFTRPTRVRSRSASYFFFSQ